ncbi:three-Cys-motif partner protein TcmP [Streptomyces sp. Je 1-369]|uniref:three-Cys-motif partner protein TcmP n=1 Tax=Streptomyces sp. Je 1-369 TaxID=2966192 RepID=UPI0022869700|nr:three-Cys-motif partner protein TcmP [Streptomyces sp. Je 1-369]WAL96915.1 three-Cys-motif partner protein TcmP [Streptomyces sp. Je 1-369]
MAVPKETVWDRDPHTAAKHDLLEQYLEAWAPILLSRHDVITYAEGFAGSGIYKQGEPGSPVIAYDVFADALLRSPKRMRLVLMEEDPRRVAELERQMTLARAKHSVDVTGRLTVDVRHGEFHPALLQRLRSLGSLDHPLFVLLDSFGGPDIPYSLLQELGSCRSTEVMVTFAPNFLARFAEKHDGHRQLGDDAFGSPHWQAVFQQPSTQKFAFLREQYRDTLRRAGFLHTLYFEMVDEGNRKLYLIFGTAHEKGLAKMKTAMWKVDPSYGVRYRDPRDVQQQELALEFEPNTAPLQRILRTFVADSPDGRTVEELQKYTLLETVYRPEQVIRLIRQMRDEGVVKTEPHAVNAKTRVTISTPPPKSNPAGEQVSLW